MARISGFRGVVKTMRGEQSRLASGFVSVAANNRNVLMEIEGHNRDGKPMWYVNIASVTSIGSAGPNLGKMLGSLCISQGDLDALAAGTVKLALVNTNT